MKMFLSLALAMLTSATTMPLEEVDTIRVEDIAFIQVIDQNTLPWPSPSLGMFAGTSLVALAVIHSDATLSIYDLNGVMGYTPVFPPLAYDLHYVAGAGVSWAKRCYLNRASTAVKSEKCCSGMTYEACAKACLDLELAQQKIDPPHPTNPTCP